MNPFALDLLARNDIPIEGLRSKSWDEFARAGSPELHLVFTVCDNAAAALSTRINLLLALPMEKVDRHALADKLRDIGRTPSKP